MQLESETHSSFRATDDFPRLCWATGGFVRNFYVPVVSNHSAISFFLPQPSNAPRGGWILLLKFFCLFALESPNRQKLSALKILCYPREKIPQFYATLLGEANRNSGRRLVMNWVAPSPASGSLPISPDIMASWKTRKDEGTENNERVIKATGR